MVLLLRDIIRLIFMHASQFTRMIRLLTAGLLVVVRAYAQHATPVISCTPEDDAKVTRCMQPIAGQLSNITSHNTGVRGVVFPIYGYAREELLTLCNVYLQSRIDCLSNALIDRCLDRPSVILVQSLFAYPCTRPSGNRFFAAFDCIAAVAKQNEVCSQVLRISVLSGDISQRCKYLPAFYTCLRDKVIMNCGEEHRSIVEESIHSFGCTTSLPIHESTSDDAALPCSDLEDKKVSECMEPVMDTLLRMKSTNTLLHNVTFPVFSFSQSELLELCEDFVRAKLRCMSAELEQNCPFHSLWEYLQALLGYACGRESSRQFFENFLCVADAINAASGRCDRFLLGNSFRPGDEKQCNDTLDFYRCTRHWVEAKCHAEGLQVLQESIIAFGCDINFIQEDGRCHGSDSQHISTCLQPLMDIWAGLQQDKQDKLGDTVFPLFRYESNELVQLCDKYSALQVECLPDSLRRKCRSNALITFTKSLFDYACHPQTIADFFEHFPCMSKAVTSVDECLNLIKGRALVPGLDDDKCRNMAQFHECIAPRVATECGAAGLNAFETAIDNFGCHLNVCREEDAVRVSNCVQPLMNVLVAVGDRKQFPLGDIIFPLFSYNRTDLLELCEHYLQTRMACLSKELTVQCRSSPLVKYILSQLSYPCERDSSQRFFDHFECIAAVVAENEHCVMRSTSPILPSTVDARCSNISVLYDCVAEKLGAQCTVSAQQVFDEVMESFGCEIPQQPVSDVHLVPGKRPSAASDATFCNPEELGQVQICTRPLIHRWQRVKATNPRLQRQAFPLFEIGREDLLTLCDYYVNVQRQCRRGLFARCPVDAQVNFLEALLAYPCSAPTTSKFFRNYQCLSDMVQRQSGCMALIADEFTSHNKCLYMAQFHECIKDKIRSRCGIDGLTTLEASIVYFGCPEHHLDDILKRADSDSLATENTGVTAQLPIATDLDLITQPNVATPSTFIVTPEEVVSKFSVLPEKLARVTVKPSGNFSVPSEAVLINGVGTTNLTCAKHESERLYRCLQPLMERWSRTLHGSVAFGNKTFPLYSYARQELLDLCDLYASSFLTCEIELFLQCRSEPILRFVDSLLGYACGNALTFFKSFSCVSPIVRESYHCGEFINIQGTNKDHCHGVKEFHSCIQRTLQNKCGKTDAEVFTATIRYFGCDV